MNDAKSVQGQRRRGWLALVAGTFIVLFGGGVWVWIDRLFAGNSAALADPAAMKLLGRLNVTFALIVVAGLLGMANGWLMARTGRRNKVLVWALVIVFISALFTAVEGANAYR
jgi:MFS family permease